VNFSYQGNWPSEEAASDGSWKVGYAYDSELRLGSVNVDAAGSGSGAVAYAYNDDDELTVAGDESYTRSATNGTVTSSSLYTAKGAYTYNGVGALMTKTIRGGTTQVYNLTLTRNPHFEVTSRCERIGAEAQVCWQYGFDLNGRLNLVQPSNGTPVTRYEYDNFNNRVREIVGGVTTAATYDAQDRLAAYGPWTFGYNEAGEMTTRKDSTAGGADWRYAYDSFGNLTQANRVGGVRVDYTYDWRHRRLSRARLGVLKTRYIYDAQDRLIAEVDATTGQVAARYVYGLEDHVPAYMLKGGVTFKFVTDQVGSVRLVVNAQNGSVAQRLGYDAFGRVVTDSRPGFQSFGFAGGLYDSDTGLTKFGARTYIADYGRWMSRDPILFEGGDTNLYGYVLQDPINFIDSSGLYNLTLGAGFSGTHGSQGFEGGAGKYINIGQDGGMGTYCTKGVPAEDSRGFNVSAGISLGFIPGSSQNINSESINYNINIGLFSGTYSEDPKTGQFAGLFVGLGLGAGASKTIVHTSLPLNLGHR
jgi:RHS repeat-associated protein